MEQVGGIVLCGGRSRRMGRPKAWLPIGEEVFLQRVVRVLATVVGPVAVVAAPGQLLPPLPPEIWSAVDDDHDRGPLQGLLAGLERIGTAADVVYVSSCDVPFLRAAFVQRMVELLDDFEIAVPVSEGRPHPLAGAYRVAVSHGVRALLAANCLRSVSLFESFRTRLVPAEALRDVDPELASLRNVNTPEDYELLLTDARAEDCPGAGGR